MDLDFNSAEKALIERLSDVLSRAAAADHGMSMLEILKKEGFLSLGKEGPQGLLQAMLVTQQVSQANGEGPVGLHALLGCALFDEVPVQPIAIKLAEKTAPVRFAEQARTLLVVGPEVTNAYLVEPGTAELVKSNYGYSYGYFPAQFSGPAIGTWQSNLVKRRWQLALVGEITGAMAGALTYLVSYLSNRKQFGRELGSFQALQHRLAELAVSLESVKYLSLNAAWLDTDEAAATTACYAANAAHNLCLEAHQLGGARGFTIEAGLYLWTLRLQSLSVEAGGAGWHASIAAAAVWGAGSVPL